jgi:hypothetical protein
VNGSFTQGSGTSFSSPLVAGVGALILSVNPSLTAEEVEQILFATAQDLGEGGWDPHFGHGRVDAAAAVNLAWEIGGSDTEAPVVDIDSPADSTSVSGVVLVDVSAADDRAVSAVELRVNGEPLANDLTEPFAFSWDSTGIPDGPALLTAVAYDASGNASEPSQVQVEVKNGGGQEDTTPPNVSIRSPRDGEKIKRSVRISASADDDSGVAMVAVYLGEELVCSELSDRVYCSLDAGALNRGAHEVTAVATDSLGNQSEQVVTIYK